MTRGGRLEKCSARTRPYVCAGLFICHLFQNLATSNPAHARVSTSRSNMLFVVQGTIAYFNMTQKNAQFLRAQSRASSKSFCQTDMMAIFYTCFVTVAGRFRYVSPISLDPPRRTIPYIFQGSMTPTSSSPKRWEARAIGMHQTSRNQALA